MPSADLVVLTGDGEGGFLVLPLSDGGAALGEVERADLADLELRERARPRWVFDATARLYPQVLTSGVALTRGYDLGLVERILQGRAGHFGEPVSAAAIVARATGAPVPPDPTPAVVTPGLFDVTDSAPPADPSVLAAAWRDQRARIDTDDAVRLLATADSTGALAAAELTAVGLPFSAQTYLDLLTEMLGPPPGPGQRPAVLQRLNAEIDQKAGFPVHPDSTTELRQAFHVLGFDLESTRRWEIRDIDHPMVPLVLRYKELSRLFSANGWAWLAEWVVDGRFRCEWMPAGVVSGRWAARGGGGLQLPKLTRRAIIADPGYRLVASDAAQLEPRVLAAISEDPVLQRLSAGDDLYDGLAADGFGGDRAAAKVAMLGAMYGATTGEAGRVLPTLRRRYPVAMQYVEQAARQGERGESVRSVLGRASPPPGASWRDQREAGALPDADAAAERRARSAVRSWGRFTRNFVVQASAADWAAVWLSLVRAGLKNLEGAQLVLFQHDELLIHTPTDSAAAVGDLTVSAAEQATRLVFPRASVRLPVRPVVVRCYADAK